ncbi:MAG: ABC transporter ATP-binding protein [Candidatus Hadarchaeaceae archaeon]
MVKVDIDRVTVTYRDGSHSLLALDQVSLVLEAGRITALVGESGSGKTTLGKSLMGLLPENARVEGTIRLGGQEIVGMEESGLNQIRWSKVAMVFQNGAANLNPVHRVVDQVAEPLICWGGMKEKEAIQKAQVHLLRMGLKTEEGFRFPHELSGGQIQRALLAMAFILDPEVVILDEPTVALDAMTKSFISGVIRRARDSGKAILLITHDLDLVRGLADDVAVLYLGQIMERMAGTDLLSSPLHPYTRGLVRSYPTLEATRDLGGIRGDAFFRLVHSHSRKDVKAAVPNRDDPSRWRHEEGSVPLTGCLFQPRCPQAVEACSRETVPLEKVQDREVRCLRGGVVEILELHQICKNYGAITALHPIDLNIRAGEIFCLVGETGSGKTTLAMIAAGLLKPDGGRRIFEGRDMDEWIDRDYPSLARRMGVIYQNPAESVSHRFSVFDLVAEPLRIQGAIRDAGAIRDRVLRALTDVRLSTGIAFLKRYPHELNMGAIQRICIARALVVNPVLLVADEPTSALDPSIQAKVLKLLLDLQIEKGLTMLFVTHNIGLARKIADRIGVMLGGRLMEVGPAHELISHLIHPYTLLLIESAKGEAASLRTGEQEVSKAGCPFAPRCESVEERCLREHPQWAAHGGRDHLVWCHVTEERKISHT